MRWNVTITVKTALHVGDGERWWKNVDFVEEKGNVRLIDAEQALERLDDRELRVIRDGKVAVALGEPRRREFTLATPTVRGTKTPPQVAEWVLRFVRDSEGQVYLPGSSLKGAFRTAIIRTLFRNEGGDKPWQSILSLEKGQAEHCVRVKELRDRKADGAQRDLLRALRVSDFRPTRVGGEPKQGKTDDPRPQTQFHEVVVRDIAASRDVLSVWAETVPCASSFFGTVSVDERLLSALTTSGDTRGELLSRLDETARNDTIGVLRTLADWSGENELAAWLRLAEAQETPPLAFLGWGTGWIAHTLGALLPDSATRLQFARKHGLGRRPDSGRDFPKTGKLALVSMGSESTLRAPLGLVTLTFKAQA